ncbi:MAG: S41 family peptidase [Candidatus Cybelea sp.]
MQSASRDKHIVVWYSDKPNTEGISASSDEAAESKFFRHIDYGFNAAVRLTGNIGYLNLGGFANMPEAKATLDSVMALLSPTDALIVDLRGNGGGDSDTVVYLLGYFFSHPTEVTGAVVREKEKLHTDRDFTPATVGAPRYLHRAVFVLIDHQTISAGEMFAYDLKTLHRALVLGEPSAGEAMGLGSPPFPLTEHLSISVPNAETRNPYTGTNWEGAGVIPDVSVSATAALLAAYKRALHASDDRYDPMNELPTALQDPAAALRASFPAVSP